MIQLVSSSQEVVVIGDMVQVMEGGTLSVQGTDTTDGEVFPSILEV